MSKHLTDAECAAEYWRALYEIEWNDHYGIDDDLDRDGARTESLHRFATLPHAHDPH